MLFFINLHEGERVMFWVSPWVITSLTFLGVDQALGLVTTLLRVTVCNPFSLGLTLSSS